MAVVLAALTPLLLTPKPAVWKRRKKIIKKRLEFKLNWDAFKKLALSSPLNLLQLFIIDWHSLHVQGWILQSLPPEPQLLGGSHALRVWSVQQALKV